MEITPEFDSLKTFKGLKVEIARSVVQKPLGLHESLHGNKTCDCTWSDEKRHALLRFMPFLVAMAILEQIPEYYSSLPVVQSTMQGGPIEQSEEICIRGP